MKGNMRWVLVVALCCLSVVAKAEGEDSEKKNSPIVKGVAWVKSLLDSLGVRGTDREYITPSNHLWALELRTTVGTSSHTMNSDWKEEDISFNFKTDNGFSTAVGFKLYYRTIGFGFSKAITGGKGSSFSFGSTSGHYGFNLRLRKYESSIPDFILDSPGYAVSSKGVIDDPIKVKSLFLDGFYMFNGKRYSYSAANKPAIIQKRSAGSLVAGGMFYRATVNYTSNNNWYMHLLMNDQGKVRLTQASVGLGYAYNWVPARGWLVGAIAMPMLTFYNRSDVYKYTVVYTGEETEVDKILDEPNEKFCVEPLGKETTPNRVILNYDCRLTVTHHWPRIYLRFCGQYNHFRYGHEMVSGHLSDWSVYAALGYRF